MFGTNVHAMSEKKTVQYISDSLKGNELQLQAMQKQTSLGLRIKVL